MGKFQKIGECKVLFDQIHPILENYEDVQGVAFRSGKKVWWKCPNGPDHIWEASIGNRSRLTSKGYGQCPFCNGRVNISNSLFRSRQVKEFEPVLNQHSPLEISVYSNKSLWWKCSNGPDHVWRASPNTRRRSDCPKCNAGKPSVTNSILINIEADLYDEIDFAKNNDVIWNQLSISSHQKIWWKCKLNLEHSWYAQVNVRTQRGQGCPFCSGRSVLPKHSLAATNKSLYKEWHPIRNKISPFEVSDGSGRNVWWKCPKGPDHVWRANPNARKNGHKQCPKCLSINGRNPVVAKEFHPVLNKTSVDDVHAGSNKHIWWKCPNGPDHIWSTTAAARTVENGTNCPFCNSNSTSINNSYAFCEPDGAKEWHPILNFGLKAYQVSFASNLQIWWKCKQEPDHVWIARPNKRSKGEGNCKICQSIGFQYPELSLEWDADLNYPLTSRDILSGSGQKFWWRCQINQSHVWKAAPGHRKMNRGCPYCNLGWTLDNLRLFIQSIYTKLNDFTQAELYLIFQQSGLLQTQGKAKGFGKALVDGRLPVEELEKFANNEPSKVDEFVGNTDTLPTENEDANTIVTTETPDESSVAIDLNEQDIQEGLDSDKPLPLIKTQQALEALELHQIASSDEEAVSFLLASAKAKLWRHAYVSVDEARQQAEDYIGGEYATQVKESFLNELQAAETLHIPHGYVFKVPGKVDAKLGYTPPLLMQRLCAVRIRDNKRYGNWSGTGAGKTISAILSSRVVDARLTVVCCPNAVVNNWREQILKVFPDSDIQSKTWEPTWQPSSKHRYLIQNFEQFQQVNSEAYIKRFIDREEVEFVIIDEIHYAKQRYKKSTKSEKSTVSRRKKLVQGLIAGVAEENPHLHVLGMSATPVINNLLEGISLLEMMMGQKYSDLSDRATVNNCMRLYQQLVTNGTRWVPDYSSMKLNRKVVEIDCEEYVPEIRALGKTPSPLALEQILTQARIPTILEHIKPKKKTLIYTHYVEEIDLELCNAIREKGFKVGFYTGKDKTGLSGFINGNVDVLIGSSSIGTGVDGLQDVCNTLIINVLPWTNAEYEQLRGRIYRQGSSFKNIDIIIPLTYANVNGERWSYCESKWKRIQFKKSIADAAVDGVVPDGNLRTPAQAQKDLLQWLERLDSGDVEPIRRTKITVPLSGEFKDVERRKRKYGDFSTMNGRWNHSKSSTLANRLKSNPEEWEQYHTLYRQARESWTVVPFEEMITWLQERKHKNYDVGDFGCGEALLASSVGDVHTIHSFDHVAINDSVVACDMSSVPLEDKSLDVVIFSLSLMGANFTDYIREAWRVLRVGGTLHIWEATSRFEDADSFAGQLRKIGFKPTWPEERGKFTYITATKVLKQPDMKVRLSF